MAPGLSRATRLSQCYPEIVGCTSRELSLSSAGSILAGHPSRRLKGELSP